MCIMKIAVSVGTQEAQQLKNHHCGALKASQKQGKNH